MGWDGMGWDGMEGWAVVWEAGAHQFFQSIAARRRSKPWFRLMPCSFAVR